MRLSVDRRLQKCVFDGCAAQFTNDVTVRRRRRRRFELNAHVAHTSCARRKDQSAMSRARRPRVETSDVRRQQVKI